MRGDLAASMELMDLDLFQFAPLREGRPVPDGLGFLIGQFQFAPLREGRLDHAFNIFYPMRISIRAPA